MKCINQGQRLARHWDVLALYRVAARLLCLVLACVRATVADVDARGIGAAESGGGRNESYGGWRSRRGKGGSASELWVERLAQKADEVCGIRRWSW
jgi:hypothetical protein